MGYLYFYRSLSLNMFLQVTSEKYYRLVTSIGFTVSYSFTQLFDTRLVCCFMMSHTTFFSLFNDYVRCYTYLKFLLRSTFFGSFISCMSSRLYPFLLVTIILQSLHQRNHIDVVLLIIQNWSHKFINVNYTYKYKLISMSKPQTKIV